MDDLERYPGAVVEVDGAQRITGVNRAALRMTGFRAEELLGRPCARVLAVRDASGAAVWSGGWAPGAALRAVRGISDQDLTVRRHDGTDLAVVACGAYRRTGDGEPAGAVIQLRRATRAGAQPSAIEIISTVSHELRSPLTSVKGYTSLMLHRWERLDDDQKRMMLQQVNHDADRVVRLITELLEISRLETGRLELRRQLVDLHVLADAVVTNVALEYPDLDATVDIGASVPRVWADPDKLEQVLTNLVENACKYATPVGLRVEGSVDGGGTVNVVVTDRGEGIPSEDLAKVFTKFFRRSEGKPTGSGLGLWISRGLVEAHGGSLTASSTPGEGSSFRFTLPAVDLEELQAP